MSNQYRVYIQNAVNENAILTCAQCRQFIPAGENYYIFNYEIGPVENVCHKCGHSEKANVRPAPAPLKN